MKIKLWPADAETGIEKAAYVGMNVIAPSLYLFMVLSAFGIFSNFYSQACHAAGIGWKIVGIVLTGVLFYNIYRLTKVDDATRGNVILLVVLAALSLMAYCGFAYPYWL